jgi:hypothetical protein
MLIIIGLIGIIFLSLFLWSACVVSSRCAREEEKYEYIRNVQKIIKRG